LQSSVCLQSLSSPSLSLPSKRCPSDLARLHPICLRNWHLLGLRSLLCHRHRPRACFLHWCVPTPYPLFLTLIPDWLGMIWRMNPSHMPHWFCVVQTLVIGLCFHILTAICVCFTWASYLTVFKPYRSIQASAS
jgi:hypothetical protein